MRSETIRPSRNSISRCAYAATCVIVRYQQNGSAFAVQILRDAHHVAARSLVQIAGGLVGKNKAWIVGSARGQRHALLLAVPEVLS